MPGDNLIRGLLLPDLELTHSFFRKDRGTNLLEAKKTSALEVCPRCAAPSKTLYDRRLVRVRDAPHPRQGRDAGCPQAPFLSVSPVRSPSQSPLLASERAAALLNATDAASCGPARTSRT